MPCASLWIIRAQLRRMPYIRFSGMPRQLWIACLLKETLETGTLLINAVIPIAKGQRQLLIGDRLTGKTTIAVDAIINQKGKDVICVYCCMGKTQTSLMKLLNLLKLKGALEYSIVVTAVASCSMGEQYLAPYTAAMLGEYFMYKGNPCW